MGDRAMIAIMLGSLVLIFGSALILYPSAADSFGANAGKSAMAELEDDEKMLKLAIDMKLAEKDLEALMKNEHNKARFYDAKVTKGMIDGDLLEKLAHMQHDVLDAYDKSYAELKDEEVKHEHMHMHAEDPDEGDVEDEEDMDVVEPDDDLEDVVVKQLDDEDLMHMALKMKLMEKEMKDFLKKSDSRRSFLFDPLISKGLIDRELLVKLSHMREDLFKDLDGH